MEDINLTFKGPFLIVKGPELWINFVKEHIMDLLNDFSDVQEMSLQKTCQKLIDDEKTQTEFKLMVSIIAIVNI